MKSGDDCPSPDCGGTMEVDCSRSRGDCQVRYLRCDRCGARDKQVVPAEWIRRRTSRKAVEILT